VRKLYVPIQEITFENKVRPLRYKISKRQRKHTTDKRFRCVLRKKWSGNSCRMLPAMVKSSYPS
jgi:hypothetical protein